MQTIPIIVWNIMLIYMYLYIVFKEFQFYLSKWKICRKLYSIKEATKKPSIFWTMMRSNKQKVDSRRSEAFHKNIINISSGKLIYIEQKLNCYLYRFFSSDHVRREKLQHAHTCIRIGTAREVHRYISCYIRWFMQLR